MRFLSALLFLFVLLFPAHTAVMLVPNDEAAAMLTMVHCHDKSRNLVRHTQTMGK